MKTHNNNPSLQKSRSLLSQTDNNATLWIGHLGNDNSDHLAGQTFACPDEGLVNNIQLYSSAVTQPGEVLLTLHEFDPAAKTWGPVISQSLLHIEKNDVARWLQFQLEPVQLEKDKTYGFRLQTAEGIIGIGEAVSHAQKPFTFGQAWSSDTNRKGERFFSYFSLAFKIEGLA